MDPKSRFSEPTTLKRNHFCGTDDLYPLQIKTVPCCWEWKYRTETVAEFELTFSAANQYLVFISFTKVIGTYQGCGSALP